MGNNQSKRSPAMLGGFIVEPNSKKLKKYMRGPVIDQIAKQALERALGKKLTEITYDDSKNIDCLLKAMKSFLEFVLSNEVDTKTESSVIKKSKEAELVEKLMHGINSLN